MKAIFFILFVLSLFSISYSYITEDDCKIAYRKNVALCNTIAKIITSSNDSKLQECKKKAQEKLDLCLKNITNTN